MEKQKVELAVTEVAIAAAVEAVNKRAKKDVFVMNDGSKIPFSVAIPFGLTAFGETVDPETVHELYNEVLEIVYKPILQQREEESFKVMAAILNRFVGKTVKSIDLAKTRNRFGPEHGGGAQETAKGRWTEVIFTDGSGFVFDAHEPIDTYTLPEGPA